MTIDKCKRCGDPECVGICTGTLHLPQTVVQHLAERSGLSQELCKSLAEASQWSAHVRAVLDAFTFKAFGYYTPPNPRLEVFAHGLLSLANGYRQTVESASRMSERAFNDTLVRSDIHIAALKDCLSDYKTELIDQLKQEVLAGGCGCNDGVVCRTCLARKRLPQIYDCAHDKSPEIRALAKDKEDNER